MSTVRLMLVDDHPVVRAGLAGMLAAEDDLDVVGEAGDGARRSRWPGCCAPTWS
jgi:DNA-binding NarL/FixJ family response regulator